MRGAFSLPAFLTLAALAGRGQGNPMPTVAQEGDRFVVTAAAYGAAVGPEGQLLSLRVNGVEFIQGAAKLRPGGGEEVGVSGLYCTDYNSWHRPLPMPGPARLEGNRLSADGNGWTLSYVFLPDAVEIEAFGTPKGARPFTAGYPPAQLAVSLRSGLERACNPDGEGEIGWPVARPVEGGDYAVLAANGAGLVFEKASSVKSISHGWITAPDDHRLNLVMLDTTEVKQTPQRWRIRAFSRPAPEHALTLDIVSPTPGHLFCASPAATFTVTVRALYGASFSGLLRFEGQGYVFAGNTVAAEALVAVTPEAPAQTVEIRLQPPCPGQYTGVMSLVAEGVPVIRKRLGFVTQPERIPQAEVPADFDRFWDDTLADLAKIPLDLTLEEQTDKETAAGRAFKVKYRSWGGRWAWAWLYVPKKEGRAPATVQCPPVSVWQPGLCQSAGGDLRMAVAVHGGDISERPARADFDYMNTGITDRDAYMMRYSYCCLARCYDIIRARPECNGEVNVSGSSQGAGLALVLGGLRPQIRQIRGVAVALCRIDWTILGLAKWGPHLPEGEDPQRVARVVSYYDPARFAHRIRAADIVLGIGLFDFCAPAEGIFSAINALPPDVPCRVYADPFGGHSSYNYALLEDAAKGLTVPRWEGTAADNKLNE
ncbi:MAG: Acetyl esterase Axe7A precursor [Lentisphaerae bacterium ADurb.BinA184]|nr:MAG: Acetyl esterase Axe7A precursor [Lentisphaerae bacterium ADurb.BinA184]